ncbi:hypothetical protein KSP39_PZI013691 [Platanthera zijinensis]|uniref:Uncharacterized protein n=1 Tax=Platanthera zijinensis TaxID=2320716 RepID=A0AAP0G473_9ASPA
MEGKPPPPAIVLPGGRLSRKSIFRRRRMRNRIPHWRLFFSARRRLSSLLAAQGSFSARQLSFCARSSQSARPSASLLVVARVGMSCGGGRSGARVPVSREAGASVCFVASTFY